MSIPLPLHVLQAMRCSADTLAGTVMEGDLRWNGSSFAGRAGEHAVLDGIFGAFFEGYWQQYSVIKDLFVAFNIRGRAEIAIDRVDSPSAYSERIVLQQIEGSGERIIIPVSLCKNHETRLILSIKLLSDGSLSEIAWETSTPPVRSIGLMAVICTFNRESDVAATLAKLAVGSSGVAHILVINQGTPGLADRLQERGGVRTDAVTILDQANLGGAGGFGRGMLESLEHADASHILLMDDDIDLDAGIVNRLPTILSYLHTEHAIGGAMLDRNDRCTLFSVGDVLHPHKPEIRNLVASGATDVTSIEGSRYLASNHTPDFNGWWFYAFPKAVIEKVGLPLPLFIRGDDVEYGYRLKQSGMRTLAWPGLAVWHSPFHLKRHPWHYFYDRRNSLFLCEMHGRIGRLRLSRSLMIGFVNHLLRFDYDRAACIMLGLRAFNEGAEGLARWNGLDHARIAALFASREEPIVGRPEAKPLAISRLPTLLLTIGRLLSDLIVGPPLSDRLISVRAFEWRPNMRHRPRRVRVLYEDANTFADFAHDRVRMQECGRGFAKEWLRFLFRRWRPVHLSLLTTPIFWRRYVR